MFEAKTLVNCTQNKVKHTSPGFFGSVELFFPQYECELEIRKDLFSKRFTGKSLFTGGVKPEGHEDDHEMVNMEYACDHCQGVIIGRRINCNVCDDFDLCYGCYHAKKYSDRY